MQKKLFKVSFIIFLIVLFGLSICVRATSDTVNASSDIVLNGNPTVSDELLGINEEEEEQEESAEEEHPEAVGSTNNSTNSTTNASKSQTSSSSYTSQTVQPTTSYSTVATIPEANLSLNNILNVILIAVGVILILLAIAILVRTK